MTRRLHKTLTGELLQGYPEPVAGKVTVYNDVLRHEDGTFSAILVAGPLRHEAIAIKSSMVMRELLMRDMERSGLVPEMGQAESNA